MDGHVYFAGSGDGFVKIGYSGNPQRRLRVLARETGRPLRLLAVYPGSRGDEHAIRAALAADGVGGEWFRASAAVMALIAGGIDAYKEPDGMPKLWGRHACET